MINTIQWQGDLHNGRVEIIDQTRLPEHKDILSLTTVEQMWEAIFELQVRGAPAIGIAAAYGVVLGVRGVCDDNFTAKLQEVIDYLGSSRPTAVNLFWALDIMKQTALRYASEGCETIKLKLLETAQRIWEDDCRICRKLGDVGAALVPENARLLTHCNAGGLATSGYGTALAVFYTAHAQGKNIQVYADETRPLWQGARLTTWELKEAGIPVTLICDNTAAFAMQQNKIDMIFVGADRIAANGDTANKIGTYNLAVLARAHGVPFYIVAPVSTFDLSIESGAAIKIEERSPDEVTKPRGITIAPQGVDVYSPAFDVTPAEYLDGIVTENGLIQRPVCAARVAEICGKG